jgi:hypothetical protein
MEDVTSESGVAVVFSLAKGFFSQLKKEEERDRRINSSLYFMKQFPEIELALSFALGGDGPTTPAFVSFDETS